MLTQTLGNRVYDYTRVVGGRDVPRPVALAIGPGDLVFWLLRLTSREYSKVSKLSIGPEAGDEQMLGEFGRAGAVNFDQSTETRVHSIPTVKVLRDRISSSTQISAV